jgi:Putative phage tail protein
MADIAFGVVGGIIGSFYGNWLGGYSIGMTLGGLLFPPDAGEVENGKSDVKIQASTYGAPIPLIYGIDRIAGIIVWGTDPREVIETSGGGKGKPKIKNYKYYLSLGILLCEGPVYKIRRIWANSKVIYENITGTGYVPVSPVVDHGTGAKWAKFLNEDDVRIYLGSYSQPKDPTIEAVMGSASTPAYRGRAFVVFEDFPITPFGNSIPNFEFEVQTASGIVYLSAMLDDLADRCKIVAGQRDFSALNAIPVDGCTINSRTETRNVFEAAQKAYLFDVIEYDGKLRADLCASQPDVAFDPDILGADIAQPKEQQYELSRQQETEVPRQINVTYKSAALDYQSFTQNAVRVNGSLDEPETLSLPFVMSEIAAKKVALVHVHLRDLRRNTYMLYYPLCGMKYAPGDVITLDLQDIGPTKLKIIENYMDFFGTMQSLCVEEDQRVYTQTADGTTIDYPNQGVDDGGIPYFRIADTGPVLDAYSDFPTILYGGSGGGTPWPGADIKMGGGIFGAKIRNAAGSWVSTTAELAVKAVIGQVVAPLPSNDPSNVLQDIDIYVDVFTGTLASATDDELLEGNNLAVWGDELIQWKTATNVSGMLWRLSGILRCRRATEWAMTHAVNEQFMVLDTTTIRAFAAHQTEWNVTRQHVMYEDNVNYSNDTPESINLTLRANSSKALAPVHIVVSRDGSQNISMAWIRRDRHGFEWEDGVDVPMSEVSLGFEVEIWNSTYTVLKRTITTAVESAAYSSANQVTDFGSNQSTIYYRIRQKQADKPWAKGHAAEGSG